MEYFIHKITEFTLPLHTCMTMNYLTINVILSVLDERMHYFWRCALNDIEIVVVFVINLSNYGKKNEQSR